MRWLIIIIVIIFILLTLISGCSNSGNMRVTKVVQTGVSNDVNVTQMKNQLQKETDNLKREKNTKGKYLLVIETKLDEEKAKENNISKKNINEKNSSKKPDKGNTTIKSMVITDGKQDALGGKMICSKQSILYRMSRTRLISCIQKYKSKDIIFWFQNYTLMNLEELSLIKHGRVSSKCNKQNIGAYIDRTLLKSCLQKSLNGGRFIYRNPSSTLIKINFKEGK